MCKRSEVKTLKSKNAKTARHAGKRQKTGADADHDYFARNFPRLVHKHGGKWIVLVQGHLIGIANKGKLASLISKARSEHPGGIPFIAPIPTRDEIECVL